MARDQNMVEVEDQEEVRLGNTTNDRFRHLRP